MKQVESVERVEIDVNGKQLLVIRFGENIDFRDRMGTAKTIQDWLNDSNQHTLVVVPAPGTCIELVKIESEVECCSPSLSTEQLEDLVEDLDRKHRYFA